MYLSCVYVPPDSCDTYHKSVFDHINAQCSTLESDVIVVVDFNAPDVNWSTLNGTSHASQLLIFVLMLEQQQPCTNGEHFYSSSWEYS